MVSQRYATTAIAVHLHARELEGVAEYAKVLEGVARFRIVKYDDA